MESLTTELIDDGAKRDRHGRRLMPRDRVAALLREYDASGATQAEFARRAGVKYPTFASWVQARRVRTGDGPSAAAPVRFAEVSLPGPTVAGLSVTLPDGVVVRGADAQALAALVRALRT